MAEVRRIKLYLHGDDESAYEKGKELGFEGEALDRFSGWGYEVEFNADVNMETGEVKLITVNGYKISP